MKTPVKITFQGLEPSDSLRQLISEEIASLEKFHGRITAGHVTVRLPVHHQGTGGMYSVHIHLALPGNVDIAVDHVDDKDERFIEPMFAVSDAFRRAERQLKNAVRKQRGETKTLHQRVERTLDQPEPPTKN